MIICWLATQLFFVKDCQVFPSTDKLAGKLSPLCLDVSSHFIIKSVDAIPGLPNLQSHKTGEFSKNL